MRLLSPALKQPVNGKNNTDVFAVVADEMLPDDNAGEQEAADCHGQGKLAV